MILIDKLKKYLILEEMRKTPKICEMGLLFGGYEMLPNRADSAIKLYKDGKIKKILITGGIGYLSFARGESEAKELYQYLIKNGVRTNDILIEDSSKNTYQNINNSYNILTAKYQNNINIMLITSDFHLKRCFFIAKKFFPASNTYGYPVQCNKYTLTILLIEVFLLKYYKIKFKLNK